MVKNIVLKIVTRQIMDNSVFEESIHTYNAVLEKKDKFTVISFIQESETESTLIISEDSLRMSKKGISYSRMLFKKEIMTRSVIGAAGQELMFDINTIKYENLSDETIKLNLEYELLSSGSCISRFILVITED